MTENSTDQPYLYLVGGSNGSGKTTTANLLIAKLGIRYLGADDIAKELNPDDVQIVEQQAGRLFVDRIREAIENKESIIVESTLSGVTLRNHIKVARLNGYLIKIVYIYLDNVDISIYRVQLRVEQGGHDVPEEALRRRFPKSRENFWRIYRLLADSWELYYNSINNESLLVEAVADGIICPSTQKESITVLDPVQYRIFLETVGETFNAT